VAASSSALASAASTLLVSTVDSDIAKMSDNEFAPVFLGGILVMLGGLLSAVFVGTIVDKKDLYASLVADSYLQEGEQDEEFWKGLSEEEQKKTREMLERVKATRNGDGPVDKDQVSPTTKMAAPTSDTSLRQVESPAPAARSKKSQKEDKQVKVEIGMFNDYGGEGDDGAA
jgi:hypothetical protein